MSRGFSIGDKVRCISSGVIGYVVKFYTPTACEEQTMVETADGRFYHAPNNKQAINRLVKHLEWGWTEETVAAIEMGIHALKETQWILISERLPEDESYILVSFENFTMPDIARYEENDEGGTFYPGDDEKSYSSYGVFVNAWMPLPEPYKEKTE